MDGVLGREDGRVVLRFERHLHHSAERVFRAITDIEELAEWFPGLVEIDLHVGGAVEFSQPNFDVDLELIPLHGTITDFDPPHLLAFMWGDDLLRFELTAEHAGTRLVFTHRFENRASAPRSAAGWSVCIDLLESTLNGEAPPANRWIEYHARYGDELGDDGTFRRDDETATLRFERLIDHPATAVWRALTSPEQLRNWLAEATIELRQGGAVELRFEQPAGYVVTGVITRMEAPKVLEFTWTSPGEPAGAVKWQLIPMGNRCLVLFTHTVQGRWASAGTLAAWHIHLAMFATALAGLPTWPFPQARWSELRDRYASIIE
jgi:uncharacterized protein YndB with AHSA1/START domain